MGCPKKWKCTNECKLPNDEELDRIVDAIQQLREALDTTDEASVAAGLLSSRLVS